MPFKVPSECECSDPGCNHCNGLCKARATNKAFRIDMQDESGVKFCRGCFEDAMESGVFSSDYPD